MPHTNTKIIVTPNAIHVYQFSKVILYGTSKKKAIRARRQRSDSQPRDDLRNRWRSKKQVGLILESNADPKVFEPRSSFRPLFATFTFAENITDLTRANKEFKQFIQRANYELGKLYRELTTTLKYLVVPEFQKRGAVHYHVIFFAFPKMDDTNKFLSRIWKHGFTFNTTISNVSHLKNYVTKYFTKNYADPRLRGKKHYFCSKGVKRPQVYYNRQNNEAIISQLDKSDVEKQYINGNEVVMYTLHQQNPLIPFLYHSG